MITEEQFRQDLKETLNEFIGRPILSEMFDAIEHKVKLYLKDKYSDTNNLKFRIESDKGYVKFKPDNLYTALLFNNKYVPYELVKDTNQYIGDDFVCMYHLESENYYFWEF